MHRFEHVSSIRFALYAVTILTITSVALADEPIPTDPSAFTMRDYRKRSIANDRVWYLEGYKQHGHRDDAWDESAIEFIQMCIAVFNDLPNAPSFQELESAGEEIVSAGCNDPLVLYGYGYAQDRQNHRRGAEQYLRAAVQGLPDSNYPATLLGSAASRLARFLEAWRRDEEARTFHQIAADAFVQAAESDPHDSFSQRELVARLELQLKNYLPADIATSLVHGLQLVGGIDPCTLNTALGMYHVAAGWRERGKGYANTVTEDGWAGFKKHLDQARTYLVKAYEIDPSRPEAATGMINVAMAGYAAPGETERLWFDRAVAAQMDWPQAYGAFMWSIRPRWGGSHEQMYEFGIECAQTERFDTDVPYQFIEVLLDIDNDQEYSRRFWRQNRVDEFAGQVLDQLASDPSHAHRANEFRTIQASMAWALRDYEAARKVIQHLGDDLDEKTMLDMRITTRQLLDDTRAFTSSFAEEIHSADRLFRLGQLDAAANAYEQIASRLEDDPHLQAILRDRIVTTKIQTQFNSGQWVELKFEDGLPGWRDRAGVWHSSTSDSIKGGPTTEGLYLISEFDVGPRFELQGKIDMSKLRREDEANVAIVFQFRDAFDLAEWFAFQIYNRQKRAWIGYRFWKAKGEYLPLGRRVVQSFEFHLQNWNNEAVLYLNGETMFAGRLRSTDRFNPGGAIGLAGSYGGRRGYAVFQDLRLRKLTERPEALQAEGAAPNDLP